MPLAVIENEAPNPADVSLLRSTTVMPRPDRVSDQLEELRLSSLLWTGSGAAKSLDGSLQGRSRIMREPVEMLDGERPGHRSSMSPIYRSLLLEARNRPASWIMVRRTLARQQPARPSLGYIVDVWRRSVTN